MLTFCDMEAEGWSGQQGWAWGTAAAKHERKLRSKREGNRAAALARNFSDIQLPKESMEIQSPPVSEGEQKTERALHEWQVLSYRPHFPDMGS